MSDTIQSFEGKMKHVDVKEISASSPNNPKAESVPLKGDGGIVKATKKRYAPIRRKVIQSLTNLKKIVRLSETNRVALIRSLKKAKNSSQNVKKGKSSKTSSRVSSCKNNGYPCHQDQVLQVNLNIGRIGLYFMGM